MFINERLSFKSTSSSTMLLVLVCAIAVASALPLEDNAEDLSKIALENPDLFGGDILESIDDLNDRSVIPGDRYRWLNAEVPYVIDSSLSNAKDVIQKGINDMESKTCLRFIPRTNQKDYVRVFKGQGCYSNVGRIGGMQSLSLGNGCLFVGTVVHEFGHALGFWHEQNRSDRDEYLEIYLENVDQKQQFNFKKFLPQQNLLLTPFDYESIMIYGNTAFSKNGQMTMKAKNGQKLTNPYSKPGLNSSDIKRLKIMYNCK